MSEAVLELIKEAKRVADYLEQPSNGYMPTHRFAPELRNLAPGLRSKAEAVEQASANLGEISPKPGEQNRDFIKNSKGDIVGVQCLVVMDDGQMCGELIPSVRGFKTHYTRIHGGNVQGMLPLLEPSDKSPDLLITDDDIPF